MKTRSHALNKLEIYDMCRYGFESIISQHPRIRSLLFKSMQMDDPRVKCKFNEIHADIQLQVAAMYLVH